VSWSGLKKREYWVENLSWADTSKGQQPVSKAIRTGETQVCHDIAKDQSFKQLKDGALAHGYLSNIALPLSKNEEVFGALCIYSSSTESFDEDEVQLLEELANDLSYGIVTLRARIAQKEQTVHLQESMEQSIQAIAATVETRDPYTAGHQRRVSDLATAIAREMNLPEDQIQGIHFAAIIHDLGKIHTPAEILSKPGKLNDLEYKLIQMHPQSGYDILKGITFPWPIADIILQHHEKLDGSGYPQGLKGDDILLEARIITVADVVEAISSHRPYRPSMGIEIALEEIKRGRGSEYDPEVVDACIKVFNEKGFTFTSD
jgi:putative nucleotidyltransferase with HDIG domain